MYKVCFITVLCKPCHQLLPHGRRNSPVCPLVARLDTLSLSSDVHFFQFDRLSSTWRRVECWYPYPFSPFPTPPSLTHIKYRFTFLRQPPPAHFIMFHFQIPFCMFLFCRISLQFLLCQKFWNTRERFLQGGQLSYYGRY